MWCMAACAAVWCMAAWGEGRIWWAAAAAALAASSCAIWRGGRMRGGRMRARAMALSWYNRAWIRLERRVPALRRAAAYSRRAMERAAERGGHPMDTERAAVARTRLALTASVPCAAAAVLGHPHHIAWAAAAAVPAVIYAAPHIAVYGSVRRRAAACGREAAFFLVYVHIVQTAGGGLYRALEMLERAAGAFPAMRGEAAAVRRMVMAGATRNGALLRYSRSHPVHVIGDFVAGYVTKQSTIGDVPAYTAEKAREAFAGYEAAWGRYEKSVQEIFGGIMMFAVILPMMIMLSAMLGTPQTVHTLLLSGTLLSPLVSVAMVAVLGQAQPPSGGAPRMWAPAAAPGGAAGLLAHAWGAEPGVAISMAALAFAASNSIAAIRSTRAAGSCERMLPEFLRDITEISRTGTGMPRMVRRLAASNPYEAPFARMLNRAAGRMRRGATLSDALDGIFPTFDARVAAFLLGVIHRTGGGTPAMLERVAGFAARVRRAKHSVSKSLAPLCGIVYATPFITLGMAHVMLGMFAGGAADSAPAEQLPFSPMTGAAVESYMRGMGLMATAMSIPMGVVAAKISAHTIRDTRPLCVVSCTNLAALLFLPAALEAMRNG